MPEMYFIGPKGELFMEDLMDGCLTNVDQEEFMVQFSTGIKAECGEEIYEGDYVSWDDGPEGDIVFSNATAGFVIDPYGRHLIDDKYGDYCIMHRDIEYTIKNK